MNIPVDTIITLCAVALIVELGLFCIAVVIASTIAAKLDAPALPPCPGCMGYCGQCDRNEDGN